jgi:hypothetical protein
MVPTDLQKDETDTSVLSDGLVNNLDWDSEDTLSPTQTQPFVLPSRPSTHQVLSSPRNALEVTPLLDKLVSYSAISTSPRLDRTAESNKPKRTCAVKKDDLLSASNSVQKPKPSPLHNFGGKSTFGQTVSLR